MVTVHDFVVKDAQGTDVRMSDWKGKVLLLVNVASQCGFTPQYRGLQALQDRFGAQPFAVVAFPCNQFGGQEPGTSAEVCEFARTKFAATFPVMAKVQVNGPGASALWDFLKAERPGVLGTRGVKWNFTKFLVDQSGRVRARYSSLASPESIAADIDALLTGRPRCAPASETGRRAGPWSARPGPVRTGGGALRGGPRSAPGRSAGASDPRGATPSGATWDFATLGLAAPSGGGGGGHGVCHMRQDGVIRSDGSTGGGGGGPMGRRGTPPPQNGAPATPACTRPSSPSQFHCLVRGSRRVQANVLPPHVPGDGAGFELLGFSAGVHRSKGEGGTEWNEGAITFGGRQAPASRVALRALLRVLSGGGLGWVGLGWVG